MAAGEADNPAVARGIAYLIATQDRDGNWDEPWYTAVGFPRVFYLRYHGYRHSSRYGRSPAIAVCRWPTRGASRSGCDAAGLNGASIAAIASLTTRLLIPP